MLASKINIQKAVAFLYARNNQLRKYNGRKDSIHKTAKVHIITSNKLKESIKPV